MRVFIRKYYSIESIGKIFLKDVKTIVITSGKELLSGDSEETFLEVMYNNDSGVHKISDVVDVEVV